MPTQRRRHAITETPPVEEALNQLRAELGVEKVDLPALVVLGARTKVAAIRADRAAEAAARSRLADLVRRREPLVDLDAASEVRRAGWARG